MDKVSAGNRRRSVLVFISCFAVIAALITIYYSPTFVRPKPEFSQREGLNLLLAVGAFGEISSAEFELIDAIREKLANTHPGLEKVEVLPSSVDGLYAVINEGRVAYTDRTARYLIGGPIKDLESGKNITAGLKNAVAAMALLNDDSSNIEAPDVFESPVVAKSLSTPPAEGSPGPKGEEGSAWSGESEVVTGDIAVIDSDAWGESYIPSNFQGEETSISKPALKKLESTIHEYAPLVKRGHVNPDSILLSFLANSIPEEKYSVVYHPAGPVAGELTVFADPSCPKCREFHQSVSDLVGAGYRVKYLLFPRATDDAELVASINALHCIKAPDERKELLDQVYAGRRLRSDSCHSDKAASIRDALGFYRVTSTPTIMLKRSGMVFPGFVEAQTIMSIEEYPSKG